MVSRSSEIYNAIKSFIPLFLVSSRNLDSPPLSRFGCLCLLEWRHHSKSSGARKMPALACILVCWMHPQRRISDRKKCDGFTLRSCVALLA
ncbi:hypothetical protein CEXT_130141 [Caerostris extrusa]|uniref:Uncharacterized protein n=1 Tax=Caerostris extrusa TaxID=172846 RepID=A0AAV4W1E9_CAEEX|nr:hypothetical protein CEXT_130141 [Caerostris extrusa]